MNENFNSRYDFFSSGIFVDPMVEVQKLNDLAKMIRPKSCSYDLIRVGAECDGGYLIPNDLNGIRSCFSPGVDDIASFEQGLYNLGIKSHLADFSVDGPPAEVNAGSFLKKYIGANTYGNFISLDDWVSMFEPEAGEDSLILQMDIEGAEYEVLLACSRALVSKFRIMVIEFHLIETWAQSDFFKIVESVFRKLLETHFVVHAHPNNAMGIVNLGGFEAPRVFELTFLKKNRSHDMGCAVLPHELDFPNVNYLPDIKFPLNWL